MAVFPATLLPTRERESLVHSITEKFSKMISSESLIGYRWVGIALLATFASIALLECALGAPPITGPWGVTILLDGAWRIVHGQVPHTDFYNPLGPLTDLLIAFGMKVAPPSTSSITYGIVLFATLLLPLTWRIAKDRLPWAIAFLFVFLSGLYILSPRPPGYTMRDTSYAMIYNRESYVLLLPLCLCLFLKPRAAVRRSDYLQGTFAGQLLGLLLYTKVTYFVAAVGLIAASAFLVPNSRKWHLAMAAAFAVVCAAMFAVFHISLIRYLRDLVYAVGVQSPTMRTTLLSQSIAHNALWMYLLIFSLLLLAWAHERSGATDSSMVRLWLVAACIVGATLFIESGNASQGAGLDDPMYFAAAVVSLELFRSRNAKAIAGYNSSARLAYSGALLLMFPLLFGSIVAGDLISYAYTVAWDLARGPSLPASQQFHSVSLRDFRVPTGTNHITTYWPSRDFPAKINDGIDLLKRRLQPGDRITTIDFANPFSFALGIPPAHDKTVFWDLHVTFDTKRPPKPSEFLGDASVVMVPRLTDRSEGFGFVTADTLMNLYGAYLHTNFHEVESTENWTMYRRN